MDKEDEEKNYPHKEICFYFEEHYYCKYCNKFVSCCESCGTVFEERDLVYAMDYNIGHICEGCFEDNAYIKGQWNPNNLNSFDEGELK